MSVKQEYLRVLHRIKYVLTQYAKFEGIKSYSLEALIDVEGDDITIGASFYEYDRCGDRCGLGYLDITPEMIEDPNGELGKLFEKREAERKKKKEEREAKDKAEKKAREEARNKRDKEEYERLKKKFGNKVIEEDFDVDEEGNITYKGT